MQVKSYDECLSYYNIELTSKHLVFSPLRVVKRYGNQNCTTFAENCSRYLSFEVQKNTGQCFNEMVHSFQSEFQNTVFYLLKCMRTNPALFVIRFIVVFFETDN